MLRTLLLGGALAYALSGAVLSAPRRPVTLRVGVESLDYLPYYSSDGKRFRGYARALLDAFAAQGGYRLVYEPLPPAALFRLFLGSQRLDLKFPDNPRWSVDAKRRLGRPVLYSASVATLSEGLVVRKRELGLPLSRLRSIGLVRGFTAPSYQPLFRRGALRAVGGASIDGLLQDLAAGQIDAVYAEFHVVRQRLQLLKLEQYLAPNVALPVDRSELALSTLQHPDVIQAFDRFLREHAEQVQALKRRYGLID